MVDQGVGGACEALGLNASPQQLDTLSAYLDLLQRWNSTYNLTAVRDRGAMITQHLADCLAVVKPLAARCPAGRLLDVGSGGGLPGVVIAALLPDLEVTCVDTVGKKAAFIRQVAGQLGLPNLHALHSRVEVMPPLGFDVITSRAFASLSDFVELTAPLLAPSGLWVAMKGRRPDDEMAALPADVTVFHVEQLQVPGLNAERCLIWMKPKP